MRISTIKLINYDKTEDDSCVLDYIIKNNYYKVMYITTPKRCDRILKKIGKDKNEAEGVLIDSFFRIENISELKEFINQSIPYDENIFVDMNIFTNNFKTCQLLSMVYALNRQNKQFGIKVLLDL